jgi:hypothetical protein
MTQALASYLVGLPLYLDALLKITALLILAWGLHFSIRGRNPRWRVLLWRGTALAVVLVPLLSILAPSWEIPVETPVFNRPSIVLEPIAPLPFLAVEIPNVDVSSAVVASKPAPSQVTAAPPPVAIPAPVSTPKLHPETVAVAAWLSICVLLLQERWPDSSACFG